MPNENPEIARSVVGILGGVSPTSTQHYYQLINDEVNRILGGHHYPEMLIASINFAHITRWAEREDWSGMAQGLLLRLQSLERAGADFLMLAANTIHMVVPMINVELKAPLLHVVAPTGKALLHDGVKQAALLGTRPVMREPFIRSLFELNYQIRVLTPEPPIQDEIHNIIIDELCLGIFRPKSKARIEQIIADFCQQGIPSIILGCTELELLLGADRPSPRLGATRPKRNRNQESSAVGTATQRTRLGEARLYKTMELHAHAAARISIGEQSLSEYEVHLLP